MLKRAVMFATMIVTFSASSLLFAGDFTINAPKKVTQGETVTIGIAVDKSTATRVKLYVTSNSGTSEYMVALVNGIGQQSYTFNAVGSVILKVEDANNAKRYNTQMLHVQPALGGPR